MEPKNLFVFQPWSCKKMEESPKISVSTQCKVCELHFTVSTIFKHISHRPSCKAGYSNDEIQAFRSWKNHRDHLIEKRKYDPTKTRAIYLKNKEKKGNEQISKGKEQSSNPSPIALSTLCKGCNIVFNPPTILNPAANVFK